MLPFVTLCVLSLVAIVVVVKLIERDDDARNLERHFQRLTRSPRRAPHDRRWAATGYRVERAKIVSESRARARPQRG